MILGAFYHRLLLPSGRLDAAYANFVVDTVFARTSAARPNIRGSGRDRCGSRPRLTRSRTPPAAVPNAATMPMPYARPALVFPALRTPLPPSKLRARSG